MAGFCFFENTLRALGRLARLLQWVVRLNERQKFRSRELKMSIQKKSLISTLKTAKKANVASTSAHEGEAKGSKVSSMTRVTFKKGAYLKMLKTMSKKIV
jgi:hypothetical protein